MEKPLITVIKVFLIIALAVGLAAGIFAAGFGTAFLVTGQADRLLGWMEVAPLPTQTVPSPTDPPPPAAPTSTDAPQEEPSPEPTRTPLPLPTPQSEVEETFQLFWEAWDLLQRHYYGDLPSVQEITYAAIRGMLSALDDRYTAFIEPDVTAILREDATGEFEGIGAFVDMDDAGRVRIVNTFEEGPAAQAGVQAEDRVIAVDGESIVGDSLYEAIGKIRGPAGTQVTLTVERDDAPEPISIAVTRARLIIPIVESEMLENDVAYIRLREFSATATQALEESLEMLLHQGPRGVILDLRQNPGGWLDQAINVADLFLGDVVVATERFSDGTERVFRASSGDIGEDIPLVVLVNSGSASASEIVAGALQDHGRAPLVGVPTFGKGSVQRPIEMSDGSELRVTIALWFTPNNQPIQGEGLSPDIEVPWPEAERLEDPERDPQLQRALELLLEGE